MPPAAMSTRQEVYVPYPRSRPPPREPPTVTLRAGRLIPAVVVAGTWSTPTIRGEDTHRPPVESRQDALREPETGADAYAQRSDTTRAYAGGEATPES